MDGGTEPRDEGGRAFAISTLLHACVLGLFVLTPPETPVLSLDDSFAPLRAHLLASIAPPAVQAPPSGVGLAGAAETPDPAPGVEGPIEHARTLHERPVLAAPVGCPSTFADALARSLGHASPLPPFIARDALAARDSVAIPAGTDGLDMIGTGHGGGGRGDTIGAPTAWGLGSRSASCTEEELVTRTALVGHVAAVASCSAYNAFGAIGMGALGSRGSPTRRVPDAIGATQRHGICRCGGVDATIHGSLSRDVIRLVVARHRSEIRYCYERALTAHPSLEGRVTAQWVVAPSGGVQTSSVDGERSNLYSTEVEACIARAVSRWTFPSSNGPTIVSYPFVLGTES